jgi:N-acetylglucosaminyldiphosphoundecaprenol N-acetyl-beta-D-mannosaminyltransferase
MSDASGADIVWVRPQHPKTGGLDGSTQRSTALSGAHRRGAAFDIHAGTVRQASRFIQRIGFEWLFRLAQEPRRLAWRYLRNNPAFVLVILEQKIGLLSSPRR